MRRISVTKYFTNSFYELINFFSPTHSVADIQKLLFMATLCAAFFLFTVNYNFPGGAYQFTDYANALAHHLHLSTNTAQRDVGYPLILWLSGYPYTQSFIMITILQTFMAIVMPVLVYISVKTIYPKVAYYIALGNIFTFSSFYYMKWIHHDQTYVFFTLLSTTYLLVFLDKKRPLYLFAMTLTVIMASLSRPAGNLLFPTYLCIAYLFVRGSYTKYVINILLAICVLGLYSHHRYEIFDMAKYEKMPSYTGEQVFYNLYINSKEYGIRLGPHLGSHMQAITSNAYQYVLPSLRSGKVDVFPKPKYFMEKYFYPFTPKEFIEQLYINPNWEYFDFLCATTVDDSIFLKASFEIIYAYPMYIFSYSLRNMWYFLYHPGYAHTRYNIQPQGEISLLNSFTLDSDHGEQFVNLSAQGIRELKFDSLSHQGRSLQKAYTKIRGYFVDEYQNVVKILFYFILITWMSLAIGLLNYLLPLNVFNKMAEWLQTHLIFVPVTAVSLILLENILIPSMFAEPDYRYHHFLISLKMILAGFGVGIVMSMGYRLLRLTKLTYFFKLYRTSSSEILSIKQTMMTSFLLGLFIASVFMCWWQYMVTNIG